MKKIILVLIGLLMITLVGCSSSPGELDGFAQCLTEKGATMYGTEWCSHCKNQKEAFGTSFQYVDYVDCDRSKQVCVNAGIKGYPTWVVDGENYPGEQSLEKLSSLSGCSLTP